MFLQQLGAWFLSILVVFGIGVNTGRDLETEEVNPELKQKVTEHIDAIVDEMAGLADDLAAEADKKAEEFKQSDFAQSIEKFCNNVKEVVENTVADIEERFGKKEPEAESIPAEEAVPAEETPVEEAAPAAGEESEQPAVETEGTPG